MGRLGAAASRKIRKILREDPDFLVPVKKLHQALLEGEALPPYPEFLGILKEDAGLVVIDLEDGSEDDARDEREMETLGFYAGPRVRLRERVPSMADMAAIIKRHTDRMLASLGQAYCAGAGDFSDDEEDAMLDLLQHAKKLKGSVDGLFDKSDSEGPDGGK